MPAPSNLCQVGSINANSHGRFRSSPFRSFLFLGHSEWSRFVALNPSMSTPQALPIRTVARLAHGMPRKVQRTALRGAALLMGAGNQKTPCSMDFVRPIMQSTCLSHMLDLVGSLGLDSPSVPVSCQDALGATLCRSVIGKRATAAPICRRMNSACGISNTRAQFGENVSLMFYRSHQGSSS